MGTLGAGQIIILLIWGIPFAVLSALAAPSRRRDPKNWFWIGLICGVFGLVAILVMGVRDPDVKRQEK